MAASFASSSTTSVRATTPASPTLTPASPAPVTPILNAGQTRVMQADPARSGWPAAGVVMTPGPYRKVGAASVKCTLPARLQGNTAVADDLFHDPLDSDQEFIAGTRLVTQPGAAPLSVSCLVRTPHARVGAAQQASLLVGNLFTREVAALATRYLNGGPIGGQPTCTLTRTRQAPVPGPARSSTWDLMGSGRGEGRTRMCRGPVAAPGTVAH
ncbi:hypothetical protein [Deinococcus soli (ex Cha et al. 2016)]|uniref:Uncharacterized protein n=2 Tax=Deinococcus soli (ex Cha et al. 2016) TaxID=1309411 RepID=A0AAE3XDE5_9DEIO|nr:hypothetical protein [Deinococcus soli (ex Cha et al. 2016)]MDR6218035.1 hypothetical protein [Deinococcus soli (ex Cha et al. 2016)]MDR6751137.1 hypothetical protein [Deinococcus soli (ex Cha et al. 2016)]